MGLLYRDAGIIARAAAPLSCFLCPILFLDSSTRSVLPARGCRRSCSGHVVVFFCACPFSVDRPGCIGRAVAPSLFLRDTSTRPHCPSRATIGGLALMSYAAVPRALRRRHSFMSTFLWRARVSQSVLCAVHARSVSTVLGAVCLFASLSPARAARKAAQKIPQDAACDACVEIPHGARVPHLPGTRARGGRVMVIACSALCITACGRSLDATGSHRRVAHREGPPH